MLTLCLSPVRFQAEPFLQPVDPRKFPTYRDLIACPMDLSTLEQNVERGVYGSTAAFTADCMWILHNCILFNGSEWCWRR